MYPNAYIEFLAHFHGTRDYFECHEVLEEHWKVAEPKNRDSVWVLFIQIAVCLYHYRRGNVKGANTLINSCINKLTRLHAEVEQLGIHPRELSEQIMIIKENIAQNVPYRSIQLPIKDEELLKQVRIKCTNWGRSFNSQSDLSNIYLINKHKLRKRE